MGLAVTVGLLFAGVGSSTSWEAPESTVAFDGSTPLLTGRIDATQRGNDPFVVKGYAKGFLTLSGGAITAEGPVLCLDVRGNTAGTFFRIAKSSVPAVVGMDFYLSLVDGGPGGGQDRMAAGALPVPAGSMTSCAPQPNISLAPFLSGGVTVKDGKLHRGKY